MTDKRFLKQVRIDELQPTDLDLSKKTLDYYSETYPIFRQSAVEVWNIDGQTYISDGHHQLFDDRKRGRNQATVKCYSPENCGVGPEISAYIIAELLRKASKARKRGIRDIEDLRIR
jgi:hypothetical protein